jgi:RHS repeat-associated protein
VGYTGHQWDNDSGLNYMQARYYDPLLGRFYSNDPIGFRDVHSFNRYAYANNNPYVYKDPDGENPARFVLRFVKEPVRTVGKLNRSAKRFLRDNGLLTPMPPKPMEQRDGRHPDVPMEDSIQYAKNGQSNNKGKKAKDSGKNSAHGDSGRAIDKTAEQIAELESQLEGASKKQKQKLKDKIKRIKKTAQGKKKGEEHSRGKKR